MINEISLALTSIKSATDIIKGLVNLKTEAAVTEKVIDLQSIILDLHSHINLLNTEFSKVLSEKKSFEDELNNINDWSVEKQKYIMAEIDAKVFVFVHKDYLESKVETYWLCAHCFEKLCGALCKLCVESSVTIHTKHRAVGPGATKVTSFA